MIEDSKIKILQIGPIPPEIGGQSYGGVATHLWGLAKQASKNGYDVYVFADTISSFTLDGIKIVTARLRTSLRMAFLDKFSLITCMSKKHFLNFLGVREKLEVLLRAYLLKRILESTKPDLIHIHSLHNRDNLSLKILKPQIPIIITDHGAANMVRNEREALQVCNSLSIASHVICVSKHIKDRLEKLGIHYPKKTTIIYDPVTVNELPQLNRGILNNHHCRKQNILFSGVSRPIEGKRLDILLKAYFNDDYLRNRCRLVIITAGEGLNYAKNFIAHACRTQKSIDALVLGPLTRIDALKYYSLADVLVAPSAHEAFSLAYIEALSQGTPLVGSYAAVGEIGDLLGIYVGERFDPNKEGEKELAQKIVKVLDANLDRKLLRRKIVENLSWDVKFKEFDCIYKEAVHANELNARALTKI
jgi:glycosyltransferase involved in cell wall biosynthesis